MGLGVISLAKSISGDITESIVNVHKSAVRLRVLSYDSVHIFSFVRFNLLLVTSVASVQRFL